MKTELMRDNLLKLNLQMFAEPGEDGADGGEPGADGKKVDAEKLQLTQEEIDKKVEAEADRKLQKALEKRQKEFQTELDAAVAKAKKEGETYAQLTEKQRLELEDQEEREAFARERKEFQVERLTVDVQKDLIERKLPTGLADILVLLEDKELIAKKVAEIETLWSESLNEEVKKRIADVPPIIGGKSKSPSQVSAMAAERNKKLKEKNQGPNPWGE